MCGDVESEEQLVPGLTLTQYCQGQIAVYKLGLVTESALTVWEDHVIAQIQNWPPNIPYRALHDLSDRQVGLSFAIKVKFDLFNLAVTPNGRARAAALVEPPFEAEIALVFNQDTSGYLGQTYTMHQKPDTPNIQYKVFFTFQTALDWLAEGVQDR
jgi:hypothetical protein